MGVPKKHKTRAGKRQRRSHHALKSANIFSCPKCKAPILPHRVCAKCGTYSGRQVIIKKEKKKRGTSREQKNKRTKEQ